VGSAAPLTVRVESGDGSAPITLNGELDMATVPVLEDPRRLLDITDTQYLLHGDP
jgi:hypothetical protein